MSEQPHQPYYRHLHESRAQYRQPAPPVVYSYHPSERMSYADIPVHRGPFTERVEVVNVSNQVTPYEQRSNQWRDYYCHQSKVNAQYNYRSYHQGVQKPTHHQPHEEYHEGVHAPDSFKENERMAYPEPTEMRQPSFGPPKPRAVVPVPQQVPPHQAAPVVAVSTPHITPKAESLEKKARLNDPKTPITLCFERMLGAADVIADDGKPKADTERANQVTVKSSNQEVIEIHSASNRENSVVHNVSFAEPALKQADEQPRVKRAYTARRQSDPGMNAVYEPSLPADEWSAILADRELYRNLVLTMALARQPRNISRPTTPPPPVIREGFFWKDYPMCESILYESMAMYYELSAQHRQSKDQQEFNNNLVKRIRDTMEEHGFVLDPFFCEKKLRDRVRCFFKTHLQNAKKRLNTLQKTSGGEGKKKHNKQFMRSLIEAARKRPKRKTFEEEDALILEAAAQIKARRATLG